MQIGGKKMAGGRPTKYESWMCEHVIEQGKLGKSIAQMAASLEIGRRTMFQWKAENEEFSRSMDIAVELAQACWEEKAEKHLVIQKDGDKLDTPLWSRSMAARFPQDYAPRRDSEDDEEKTSGSAIPRNPDLVDKLIEGHLQKDADLRRMAEKIEKGDSK